VKTVVTGATGHVGINLVRALLAKGRDVRALTHNTRRGLEELPVEFFKGDVCDVNSLTEAFNGADVVFHLAAHISLLMDDAQCSLTNFHGTQNVIEACKRNRIRRLVHFSSIHALCNEPTATEVDESRALVESAKSPAYDRSKAGGEKAVRQAIKEGLDAIIINPTAVIGPYDYRPSHQGQALLLMASGRLPMLLDGGYDWVDVRDVAEYAIKAGETAPAGSSYLLSGHWLSVRELAQIAVEVTGKKAPTLTCPMALARACAPAATAAAQILRATPIFTRASLRALKSHRHISHARATRELGYEPRPVRQTITDTIKWFLDNGYLGKNRVSKK
jgi:dihydroflavonol-4-reductase